MPKANAKTLRRNAIQAICLEHGLSSTVSYHYCQSKLYGNVEVLRLLTAIDDELYAEGYEAGQMGVSDAEYERVYAEGFEEGQRDNLDPIIALIACLETEDEILKAELPEAVKDVKQWLERLNP